MGAGSRGGGVRAGGGGLEKGNGILAERVPNRPLVGGGSLVPVLVERVMRQLSELHDCLPGGEEWSPLQSPRTEGSSAVSEG